MYEYGIVILQEYINAISYAKKKSKIIYYAYTVIARIKTVTHKNPNTFIEKSNFSFEIVQTLQSFGVFTVCLGFGKTVV